MRYLTVLILSLTGSAAQAHVGHLGEAAGHGHWLGAAAAGAAIAIGLWAGLRGRGKPASEPEPAEQAPDEDELQEA
ncbi:hypothetical protein AIOL_004259 [Candidatus Rhodobacter oscarellae]|uniref:Uncharacterized protein n=1 Tax=Candidatus Rhodobacter oscarellae TaxID=1675527 RepID=A0A0J9H0L6_9RHOB|nr:DUF6732 family protein [Candidatus Rhodobacter lobularis]KMW59278.1 hypothetical protein AIOL_004259 [Candidatus Rhodobacter lobularis]